MLLDAALRDKIKGMQNPYGSGNAAKRIVARLMAVGLGQDLVMKRFHDLP